MVKRFGELSSVFTPAPAVTFCSTMTPEMGAYTSTIPFVLTLNDASASPHFTGGTIVVTLPATVAVRATACPKEAGAGVAVEVVVAKRRTVWRG